ncbi:hypothetical protein G9A89_019913 [Geosiphon pyriformis]|nr:hypothetical protein G9A89_019913 [Geosiphon pyriformis]
MEPVGSSVGGSGLGLAGLGTCQNAKNKHVDMVYDCDVSYKKSKKPAAGISVESSAGLLHLEDLSGDNGKLATSWRSRVGSISSSVSDLSDVENLENLVAEETSYVDSGKNNKMDKTTLHRTRTQMYMLEQPFKTPLFATMNDDDDNSVLPPPKINDRSFGPVKLFALDMNLLAVPDRTNSDKLISIKKFFYKIDGFGKASTPSKFPGVIHSTFTSKSSLIKAREMAIHEKIVVNSDLKKANIHLNQEVIIKKISVDLPKLAVKSVFSKFGRVVFIRMQLIGLWQKTLIEFELSEVASLVVSKWSVLMEKDLVHMALAVSNKQMWVSRDQHWALLYTLLIGTTAHNLSGLLDSYVMYVRDRCAVICFANEASKLAAFGSVLVFKRVSFGVCSVGGNSGSHGKRVVTDLDRVCLASIYKKKQAPVTCPVSFGDRTWASVVGALLVHSSYGDSLILGSNKVGKPLPSVVNDLKEHLINIESSFISLAGQIDELAKRLNSLMLAVSQPSPGWKDIVMGVGLGDATGDETAAIVHSTASLEVVKLENMLEGLAALVMSLSVRLDGLALAVNSSLAKHVYKVSEVPGQLLSIKLLFKNKLSVFILGLYAGASLVVQFSQTGEINSLIAKAVNESSFIILGGDFNEDGSHKCASFKKWFDLDLINSLRGSSFVKSLTWCNSCGISKTIDYVFISSNLVGVIMDCDVDGIEDYFDTDHKAVYVSVGLGGLLNVRLNLLHKQANRDYWKYDINNTNEIEYSEFRNTMAANVVMFSDEFDAAKWFSNLDVMLDSVGASPVNSLFLSGTGFNAVHSGLAKTRKSYCFSKLLESKCAEESSVRQAIGKRMESFEVDKSYTIRSVLEHPFRKVVLDYLVDGEKLVLEPDLTRKCVMAFDISGDWARQFRSLDHVFDSAFSNVMYSISFDEMFGIISNLPNGKVAGLSVSLGYAFGALKFLFGLKAWILIIPKLYEWEGVLMNTCLIALIETACKISLACSTFDVLYGDNFSVLKSMFTQLLIFAIGSVIKDALEKNQELWLRSLVRIKMCNKFIRFFGSIHNGRINRVMTDFGLTDKYHVHDGLDQGEVFLPFLWHIFYDSLLCEVKKQKSICGYRLIFHFVSKTGQVESQAGLMLFLATGVFVNDTIWVSSSQAATQHILNVASNFFYLNDISINNNKTVAIPINCQVTAPCLTISGMPISITKRDKSHHYLGIFLSSEGFSKPSLVKTHSDVRFFINLVLRKAISDKQFAYLVSSVLFPIISYRTQFSFIPFSVCNKWDALIHKGLKSKFGLPLNFPNDALHHSSLYNLKTFEQIQAESKSASVIAFVNLVGVLGRLFSYRSHNLQVLSWCPRYLLLFSVHVRVSPSNNFLADVVRIFSGCDLSLDDSLTGAFYLQSGTPMSLVLGKTIFFKCVSSLRHYGIAFIEQLCDRNGVVFNWKTFKHWKKLDPRGPVPSWFDLSICFFGGVTSPSRHSSHESSLGFGVVCNDLLNVGAVHLSVYTDGSLSNLGIVDILAETAVFFENINSGLGVEVSGLVFSTLVELQAIALVLECVPSFHSVDLFLDSQVAIDACRSESLSVGTDFRNHCWIECHQITNVICHKNLDVNWIKVKGHSGVSGNEHANVLAKDAALSAWHLSYLVSERFLKTGVGTVSGNSRHFVRNIYRSIHYVHWEVGSGSWIVPGCLYVDIDWSRSSLVWHLNSHMATGSTSIWTAGFHIHTSLLDNYAVVWEVHSGLSHSFLCISQLLSTCISDVTVSTTLCKGFVFGNWYCESVSVYKDPKVAVVNVINFVCEFCLVFHNNIWLVCAKHQVIMEKNKLISRDDSISVAISGFSMWLSAGVIRLLGIADALGISFGYCKHCLFYVGVGDMAFIHISA